VLNDRSWIQGAAATVCLAAIVAAVVIDESELRVGLFGLVGTLVGALATLEATQMAARGDRRARNRAAGRLLQEDLMFARTRCVRAEANKRFWAPRFDLRLDGWESYRDTVAKELADSGDWASVAGAFEAMRSVQSKCSALRRTFGEQPGLGPQSRSLIADYLDRSDAAIDALRRLSGDRPPDEAPQPEGSVE
jgi:hypothetical protein